MTLHWTQTLMAAALAQFQADDAKKWGKVIRARGRAPTTLGYFCGRTPLRPKAVLSQ